MAESFGVVTYKATDLTAIMTIENVDHEEVTEIKPRIDENGNVSDKHYYRKSHKITATGTLTGTLPSTEDTLSIDVPSASTSYVIENVKDTESFEDDRKCTLEAVYDVPSA